MDDGGGGGETPLKMEQTRGCESLTDPVERRRRQNRLNQRAFRKFYSLHSLERYEEGLVEVCELELTGTGQRKRNHKGNTDALDSSVQVSAVIKRSSISPTSSDSVGLTPAKAKGKGIVRGEEAGKEIGGGKEKEEEKDKPRPSNNHCTELVSFEHLQRFTESAYQRYMHGLPAADQLITLSKVNVFRAFATIMDMMGMPPSTDWMDDNALSVFTTQGPGIKEHSSLPLALRPTMLQNTIVHHPWLDFFPVPKVRDNLLCAGDAWDDEAFCVDIMGFWDSSQGSDCSLLVWGDPLNPASWEVTEEFLRKWPWVVRGCPEILQSTNYWRQQRGDKLIFRYV